MKSIVVCGSKKFKDEIREFCLQLKEKGILVFEPNIQKPIFEHEKFSSDHITNTIFKGLTLEHFEWIAKADICFIYNKNNYIGTSVTLELAYAVALNKTILALSPKTGDPCSDSLIDFVCNDSEDVIKFIV